MNDDAPLNHSTQNNGDEMKNYSMNRISDKNSNHTYAITNHDSGIEIDIMQLRGKSENNRNFGKREIG